MEQITMQDTELVGGSGLAGWVANQILSAFAKYALSEAAAGNVDYAGLAEQQGHYYNMVGA